MKLELQIIIPSSRSPIFISKPMKPLDKVSTVPETFKRFSLIGQKLESLLLSKYADGMQTFIIPPFV